MIALISQRITSIHGRKVDQLEESYISYFEKKRLTLIPVPNNTKNLEFYLGLSPSVIILSGGGDINSELSKNRDLIEKRLLEYSIQNKIPLLGICRGFQFINLYLGGKIISLSNFSEEHVTKAHPLSISGNLRKFLGNEILTNSYHDSGLTKTELATSLKSFAETEEGIIEAIYHPSLPILGIAWHPERESPDGKINEFIIDNFLNGKIFEILK